MKIVVCVKVCNGEINPFDEGAIECALRLSKNVTVVSMGAMPCGEVLKPLTRLGIRVILVSDKMFAGSDTLATSYILSKTIEKLEYDLIICGRQSVDGDTAQVGPMLAQKLGLNLVSNIMKAEQCDEGVVVTSRDGEERLINEPCLMTVERNFVLRFASIFSRVGEIEVWDNTQIQCLPEKCGIEGSPTRVLETFENKRGKRNCKFITSDELLPLIETLKRTDSLKNVEKYEGEKLKYIWAIGERAAEVARPLCEKLKVVEMTDPNEIAERAKEDMPDAILWNSDQWGRNNAPYAAAVLDTGLCADCTRLEAKDGILYMYRPARSGNVIAKIKCITKPQTATVRCESESSDIIVSGGRGVSDKVDKLKTFADEIGAEIGASRGLVDMGKMPYESQVGLTGKQVAPKIYIAVGISGAVHHTCAIEDSRTVIAINPDKDARIFEYADYGIVAEF